MGQDDDKSLIRRFQQGDASAFAEFVSRHNDRLYRLARVWTFRPELAEDAVQETFLRSYTGLGRFRFRSAPSTWIFRVCKNVCNELNRSAQTQSYVDDGSAVDESTPDERGVSPQLLAALNALPQRQRDVVVLRIMEDLSVKDTAQILRCREGTVKATLHQALGKLRGQLDERNVS